jgi:predicted Ser/Thr protein kinase
MSAAPTSRTASPPRKLGSFEVLERIAEGGMGVVYLARQPALGRFVVLKKIRGDLGSDANILERFQREARAAAGVHHQNVVAVYDCFSIRGDHYIAQEYVDGQDLRTVLSKLERLDPHIAHLIALEIARALEEIHAGGIVHRDLKPANILLGKDGETKIADFGIALEGNGGGLTRPGTVVGSVPYLSPEQMLGERIDCRSDLFQFGILLYEMVAGAPPFEESNGDDCDTLLERMQRGLYASPRKGAGSLPGHLVRLIKGCLRARPAKRIPSATHIRRRLERRLGNISPVDCRQAIADYLWSRGVFEASDSRSGTQPLARFQDAAWKLRVARWAVPAVTAALATAFVLAGYGFGIVSRETAAVPTERARAVPSTPTVEHAPIPSLDEPISTTGGPLELGLAAAVMRPPPAPVSAPATDPARVRFVALPWAEVRLEDGRSVITPSASYIDLPPGTHRITFEHTKLGRHETTVELASGDDRVIRHSFGEAQP